MARPRLATRTRINGAGANAAWFVAKPESTSATPEGTPFCHSTLVIPADVPDKPRVPQNSFCAPQPNGSTLVHCVGRKYEIIRDTLAIEPSRTSIVQHWRIVSKTGTNR